MTNDLAIRIITGDVLGTSEQTQEAITMAVKALSMPSAEPTLREKALSLLLDWAVECGFGYDNIPEEYAMYEKNIENMGYNEGLVYIAERELEHNERHDI